MIFELVIERHPKSTIGRSDGENLKHEATKSRAFQGEIEKFLTVKRQCS
jgi:hypothetical protein